MDPTAALAPWARKNVFAPIRWLVWLVVLALLSTVVATPLGVHAQTLFGAAVFVMALTLSRGRGRYVTLVMMLVSVAVSSRYIFWRLSTTVGAERTTDTTLSIILLVAECYAFLVLLFGYIQTAWPLRRRPVALPSDPSTWPSVDVFIPTYNEPLSVVRATILAASALDWPADKLNVYVLDDGKRDEFRAYCAQAGVRYLTRPNNRHAKAGNINHAMTTTHGDYIAIFDCDHVPTRSFLQLAMGWLVRDRNLAMVQTPHHFYSPDPFERNLGTFRKVPNEGELFYGVIQKGNDLWDATFFCGSCAVIKRGPLEEIGGIAPETVTEDAHTMLKLHRRGYSSAYLNLPLSGGLATESLSAHVGQRIRWARGMAQIFRIDNPFFGRGLRLFQRFCYAAAMLHFFYGIPRIIFLTAPLAYLLFDAHIFNAPAALILAYALPHLAHSILTNSRIQGQFRHSFWAEVYEAVLAYYITIPTTLAIISPRLGSFNVTAKGGVIDGTYFDKKIARPYILLILLNLVGVAFGIQRIISGQAEPEVVGINLTWTVYNLTILSAALAVAWEKRQRRTFPRVVRRLPAVLWLGDGKTCVGHTLNVSMDGMAIATPTRVEVEIGDTLHVALLDGEETPLPVEVVRRRDTVLHVRFVQPLAIPEESALVRTVFSPPTTWLDWTEGRRRDSPGRAIATIGAHALRGAVRLPAGLLARRKGATKLGALLLACASLALPSGDAHAEATRTGDGWVVRSFEDLGLTAGRRRYSTQTTMTLPFYARGDEVLTEARLAVRLDPAAPVPPGVATIAVHINGEKVGVLPLDAARATTEAAELPVDSRLLGEKNTLTFAFDLPPEACATLVDPGSWLVLVGGELATRSAPLPLPSDLSVLPLPFYDAVADAAVTIPIAVLPPADLRVSRVASLVASWFGLRAGERLRFPTTLGALPATSAVVLVTNAERALIPGFEAVDGPTVTLIDHPAVAGGHTKLLVVAGRDVADLEVAARRMVLDYEALTEGAVAHLVALPEPPPRVPYDAPRWIDAGAPVKLSSLAPAEKLRAEGAIGGTIAVQWRMPPDVFTWPDDYVELDLAWAQDGPPGVPLPSLEVELNGRYITRLPAARSAAQRQRQSRRIRLPIAALAGYDELAVHVVPPGDGFCPNLERDGVTTTLLGDSALHFEGYPHFAELPDMQRFVDDGYPFTRLADLSGTAIVLPEHPSAADLATTLSFAAHAAAVTGYPPLGARFVAPDAVDTAADRDLVVIGEAHDQPLVGRWSASLPIRGLPGRPIVPDLGVLAQVESFVAGTELGTEVDRAREAIAQLDTEAAFVMGLPSPYGGGKSAVVITATAPTAMPDFIDIRAFSEATSVRSDALIQAGDRRMLFRLASAYSVGSLPPAREAQLFLARHWLLLIPALLLAALIGAWVGRRRLAYVEYRRLAAGGEG
jgi:cellulose synthase (UDP-forming)